MAIITAIVSGICNSCKRSHVAVCQESRGFPAPRNKTKRRSGLSEASQVSLITPIVSATLYVAADHAGEDYQDVDHGTLSPRAVLAG